MEFSNDVGVLGEYQSLPFGIRVTIDGLCTQNELPSFVIDNIEKIEQWKRMYLFVLLENLNYVPSHASSDELDAFCSSHDWRFIRAAAHERTFVVYPDAVSESERHKNGAGKYFHSWKPGDILFIGNGVVHGSESEWNYHPRTPGHIHPYHQTTALMCGSTSQKICSVYQHFFQPEDESITSNFEHDYAYTFHPHFWSSVSKAHTIQQNSMNTEV